MDPQRSDVIPQLRVFGACGLTVQVPINGVMVSFTCTPEATQPKLPEKAKEGGVLIPGDPSGGHGSLVTIDSEHLDRDLFPSPQDIDPGADPVVIATPAGGTINFEEWSDQLASAKEQRRPVNIEITERESGD